MLGHENIVSFPHLGASTPESEDNCAVMAANELMEYLETGNTVNSVNLPNLTLPPQCRHAACLRHSFECQRPDQQADCGHFPTRAATSKI